MLPARVSLVTLGVHDLEAQRSFYARLGWREGISSESFVAFDTGGAILALFPIDELIADAQLDVQPNWPAFRGVTLAINVEEPEQVDAALGAAVDAGAKLLKAAQTASFGVRSGYFADPEGNVWEVAHMPGSGFDQRGGMMLPAP